MNWHLMRVDYRTDVSADDPEYRGSSSGSIPDRALQGGRQIVAVDWSEHGWVQVTFLMPGDGPAVTADPRATAREDGGES